MKDLKTNPPIRHWLDRWHVDPSANRTYDFIDGLRGLAILMVLASHSFYAREQHDLMSRYLLQFSGTLGKGVDLFFTLSGFLISWAFWKRKASGADQVIPPGYGWRRFWKIYPPLALSILLLTPCYILVNGNVPVFLHTAAQWLTGLAFLMPVSNQLNPVMWSLVVEVHFYLVLPLLFLLSKPLSARATLWIISLFLVVVPVSIQSLTGMYAGFTPEINDPFCDGLSSFCFGVAVAGIDALKIWNRHWAKIAVAGWFVALAGLAGIAAMQMIPPVAHDLRPILCRWLFMLGTGCLLCYAADPDHPHARWLCAPWLRWCGIISYEWYLFHQPMIMWGRDILGPANGGIFKYFIILAVPVAASASIAGLIYRLFSLPILKYGRSQKSARKARS